MFYKFSYINERIPGDGVFIIFVIPAIIVSIIVEVCLLYVVYNMKEPDESNSD